MPRVQLHTRPPTGRDSRKRKVLHRRPETEGAVRGRKIFGRARLGGREKRAGEFGLGRGENGLWCLSAAADVEDRRRVRDVEVLNPRWKDGWAVDAERQATRERCVDSE